MDSPVVVIAPPSPGDMDNVLGIIQRALSAAGFQVSFAPLENLSSERKGTASQQNKSNTAITVSTTNLPILATTVANPQQTTTTTGTSSTTTTNSTPATPATTATATITNNIDPVSNIDPAYVAALERQVVEKESELDDLENHLTTALTSIKTFHVQQKELFDEFVALRDKYDTQKDRLNTAIWEYLPAAEGPLDALPPVVVDPKEQNNSVGDYEFGVALGEGQFAKVRACTKRCENSGSSSSANGGKGGEGKGRDSMDGADLSTSINLTTSKPKQRKLRRTNSMVGVSEVEKSRARYDLAVKIIKKDKIQEARDIYRLHSEILNLKRLQHPNVVQLVDVIHTTKFLYLITDRGGDDLFEYITKRRGSNALSRETVQSIMTQLVSGVSVLHDNGVCHRDLKPENVLLDIHEHLMIVDFGLCEDIRSKQNNKEPRLLSDFCGR